MESNADSVMPVRIIKEVHGFIELDNAGVQTISLLLKQNSNDEVIILSIVGPRTSGKSCFLNLILKYLRSEGHGNWCNELRKKNEPLQGFPTKDRNYPVGQSGVYCWPELLILHASKISENVGHLSDNDGKKFPVLLLDSVLDEKQNGKRSTAMDMFLFMFSTKVIINCVENIKIDDLYSLTVVTRSTKEHYNQITFLIRDSEPTYGQSNAMSQVKKLLKDVLSTEDFKSILEELPLFKACFMKRPELIPLCDAAGFLQNVNNAFFRSFKPYMNTLLDPDSLIAGVRKIPDLETILEELCNRMNNLILELDKLEKQSNVLQLNELDADKSKGDLIESDEVHLGTTSQEAVMESSGSYNDTSTEKSHTVKDAPVRFQKTDSKIHESSSSAGDSNHSSTTNSNTKESIETNCKTTTSFFMGTKGMSLNLSLPSAGNIQSEPAEDLHVSTAKQTIAELTPADKELCEAKIQALLTSHESQIGNCLSEIEPRKTQEMLVFNARRKLMEFLKTKFGVNESDVSNWNIMEKLDEALNKQYKTAEEKLLLRLQKQSDHETNNSAKQEQLEVLRQSGIPPFNYIRSNQARVETIQRRKPGLKLDSGSKVNTEYDHLHQDLVKQKLGEFENVPQNSGRLDNDELKPDENSKKAVTSDNKMLNSTLDTDRMEGTNNTSTEVGIDALANLVINGTIILDGDQELAMRAEVNGKVDQLLSEYEDRLTEFARTINIHRPASSELIKNKIKQISVCASIQKKLKLNFPEYLIDGTVLLRVEEINSKLLQRLQFAQEEYNSCSESFKCKLEDATRNMGWDIINGRSILSPRSLFSDVLRSHMLTVQLRPQHRIQNMVESDTSSFLCDMIDLEKSLNMYKKGMVSGIELHFCLSPEQFEIYHEDSYAKAQKEFKTNLQFFPQQLETCIEKMQKYFEISNRSRSNLEKELVFDIAQNEPSIKSFYNNMMTTFTNVNLWTSSQLQDLHNDVVGEITKALQKASNFESDSGMDFHEHSKLLQNELNPILCTFQENNKIKGDKLAISVGLAIKNQKKSYNNQMEDVLEEAGQSMDPEKLQNCHDTFLNDVCNGLNIELTKMEGLGGVSSYVKMLKRKVECDWTVFKEENEIRWKQMKPKEREVQNNSNAMAEPSQQYQQRLAGINSSSITTNTTVNSVSPANIPVQLKRSPSPANYSYTLTHHLAIEFGPYFTRVGYFHPTSRTFEIIQDEWGRDFTPSVLAMTKDNELLFGNEVNGRLENQLKWKYSLIEILKYKQANSTLKYDYSGLEEARKELIMGLMLSKVKKRVEKHLQGRWETVVLTVPLRYTSVRRQATRDAATIAGFKHIHLINDTSACAMSYKNSSFTEFLQKKMTLVGVCTDTTFDSAVYEISRDHLEMKSSCLSTLQSQQSSGYSLGNIVGLASPNYLGYDDKLAVEQKLKTMIRKTKKPITTCACINTGSQSNGTRYDEIAFLQKTLCVDSLSLQSCSSRIFCGAAVTAWLLCQQNNSSQSPQQSLLSSIVREKLIHRFEVCLDKKTYPLFECNIPLVDCDGRALTGQITLWRRGQPFANGTYATIKESSTKVGSMTFWCPHEAEKVYLTGTISYEGILKIELYVKTKYGLKPLDFDWYPYNMTTKEVQDMAVYVQSFSVKSEEKEVLEHTRNNLKKLLDNLTPELNNLHGIKKAILTKLIDKSIATISNSTSTAIMMEHKIEQLQTLRSKYSV